MAGRDYTVEVKTSDKARVTFKGQLWIIGDRIHNIKETPLKWLAGTDDDVFVKIDGTNGTTDWVKINNKMKNDFEKGNLDRFNFSGQDLGKKTKLTEINWDSIHLRWAIDYGP